MERLKEAEVREIKEDHAELRRFVKEISLKLRRRRSQDDDAHLSLYQMMTDNYQ